MLLSDYSDGMVSAVKEKFSQFNNAAFEQIDIQNIAYDDESFDIIIANHMLYHIPDLEKALSEIKRVLKTNGYFYATTNGNGGMRTFLHKAMKQFEPDTKAFTQEWSFSLQNGAEILQRYFSSVERIDYKDSLAITETQDLIDWLKSTVSIASYSDENIDKLYDYFEEIRMKNGTINIEKECGLFICKNTKGDK